MPTSQLPIHSDPEIMGGTAVFVGTRVPVQTLLVRPAVNDFNGELTTGESRGDTDAERNRFCGAGSLNASEQDRVNYAAFMRYALRGSLQGVYALENLGFRCVKD